MNTTTPVLFARKRRKIRFSRHTVGGRYPGPQRTPRVALGVDIGNRRDDGLFSNFFDKRLTARRRCAEHELTHKGLICGAGEMNRTPDLRITNQKFPMLMCVDIQL